MSWWFATVEQLATPRLTRATAAAVAAPPIAAWACFTIATKVMGDIEFRVGSALVLLMGWLIGVTIFVILEMVPLTYLMPRPKAGRCGACRYDLRGSPGPTCPECGRAMAAEALASDRESP